MSFPRYPTYKPSGVEWLGEVPEHWEIKPLKRLAEIQTGLAKGKEVEPEGSIEVPFLRVANVQDDFLDLENVHTILIPESSLERYLLRPGDVLMNEGGDFDKLGRGCIWDGTISPCIHQNHVFAVRPHLISPSWLNAYTSSIQANSYFISRSKQSTNLASISSSNLMDLLVPVAPDLETKKILDFLDHETAKIDALIAEQQRLIELLQEKRQAVISHAVTKGLNPDAPMKDSGVEWLGEVPEHWTVMPLRLAARIESGHTPSRSHEEYWIEKDCVYPWFTLGDVWQIRDGKAEYVFETQEKVSQVGLDNSAARMLPANTVILSRTASVGFSGILGDPMATTQDFVNWVCGPKIAPEFLLFVFRAMSKEFERLKYGSTHNTIYMPDIFSFRVALPSLIEQGEIVSNVRESLRRLDGSFDDLLSSKELLQERRSALISAAVTGQIDVRGLVPEAVAA
ncbi:MAG: restriction endonuclease subunit S [Synechococcaceae cyanobacterium ELA263]